MEFSISVESRHTATVKCRALPQVPVPGEVTSMRALGTTIETIGAQLGVYADYDQVNGFCAVKFESDTSADLVAGAARMLAIWLQTRRDFVAA